MPDSEGSLPVEWVSADIIRQVFNAGQYHKRARSGELAEDVMKEFHPATPPPGEPFCTWSQMVFYRAATGEVVALVHQYLRPDGTIGASGRPDPKRLILKDKIIAVRAARKS